MSIATTWLHSLRAKRRALAEPPEAAQIAARQPDKNTIDNSVRMHIAASDPEFPAKREAAVEAILAAINPIAQAHGFTRKAKSWAKTGRLGDVSVHLQRSRYGFESYINLGFQPNIGEGSGPWAQDDFLPLGRFFPIVTDALTEPGALIYLDIFEDAASLTEPMQVLNTRALPWLLAQLEDPEAHARPF